MHKDGIAGLGLCHQLAQRQDDGPSRGTVMTMTSRGVVVIGQAQDVMRCEAVRVDEVPSHVGHVVVTSRQLSAHATVIDAHEEGAFGSSVASEVKGRVLHVEGP